MKRASALCSFFFSTILNAPDNLDEALDRFWESQRGTAIVQDKAAASWGEKVELPPATADEVATRLFADKLIRGVLENQPTLDERIKKHAENWDLHRMAVVDRNVLRLAIFEMLYRDDIPPIVSINEAVDVAKKFSTQDSGKFVNGILDKVKNELMRPSRICQMNDDLPAQRNGGGAAAGFADLHLHTYFSDGTFSPEELADRGGRLGLVAMALTDHDTIEGCERMAQACQGAGVEFVAGAEFTAEFEGREVHLLGYYLDPANEKLRDALKRFQTVRQSRIEEMVRRLNCLGIPLTAETVLRLANCRSPGRPHVGRALVQEGLCGSMDEAFDRFLKKGRPAWVPKFKIDARDAIELIHQAGGLAALAHPVLNQGDEMIPSLVEQGLDGLECFHTKHTGTLPEHYLKLAARHHLLVTGGSDCHGFSKGKPLIGGAKLPGVYFDKLKEAHLTRARPAAAPAVAHDH